MKLKKIVLLLIINLIISGSGIANEKAAVISGKIIFESTRDFRKDKVYSLYLWENGLTKKIFVGVASSRFDEEGAKIAVGRSENGDIVILDLNGQILESVSTNYYPLEVGWLDSGTLFYVGTEKEKIQNPKYYLMQIDLSTGKEMMLYATGELGQIRNVSWKPKKDLFIFELTDKLANDKDIMPRVVFFYKEERLLIVQYLNAFTPVLLNDDKTLIFTSSYRPDGSRIQDLAWSALIEFNIDTKAYKIIRPTTWVHNMRLSRDGKYLYTSENVKGDGIGTHIYSIDNLKEPIYVIQPMKDQYGTLSQDSRPDWIY